MHESGYFPPLPLNLFISARAQSFEKGSEWLVTGFSWSRSTHCWSLHFPPPSNWYRWLFIYLKLSYLLYYLLSYCQCWIFIVSTFLKHLYSKSWRVFWFSTTPWIIPFFFLPSSLFCTLLSFRGTRHFKNSLLHKKKQKKQPKWIFSKTIYGIFKLFAPVCWWLAWFVCDCKYFHDDATLL